MERLPFVLLTETSRTMRFRLLLREPLVHFLALGALLFVIGAAAGDDGPRANEIVVTPGEIESLVEGFRRTWQRPPTQAELEGLVDERVKEEVFFREAQAMGLDQGDAIIRRRLRQKLEFMTEDLATQAEPSEAELQKYLEDHADRFRRDDRLSFAQIYVSADRRGREGALREAERLLAELASHGATVDPGSLGDRLMLGQRFDSITEWEVGSLFGGRFAEALRGVEPGAWAGPFESGYGLHLVYVEARQPSEIPALAEVAEVVRRELLNERRERVNAEVYGRMLERYAVVVEWPEWTGLGTVEVASR